MRIVLTLLLAFLTGTLWCQPSVLSLPGRSWFKFSVASDGVYRIDYATLQGIGFNPDSQDPKKIQLFASHLEGMLPQPNSPRNGDLQELPILVVDGNDGKFNPGDYLLFYGKGPDRYGVDPATGTAFYENHLYDDKNYYFLTGNAAVGLRLSVIPDQGGNPPVVSEYDDLGYYESELTNELQSGRKWYGERFGTTNEYTIRFDQGNVIDGSTIELHTGMMGKSYDPASFQVFINNNQVANQVVPAIPNIDYAVVGAEVQGTIQVNANTVGAVGRPNQDVKVRFTKGSSAVSIGYLDYLLLHTKRSLSLSGNQTIFRSWKSLEQPVTRYSISNVSADASVWDVTNYTQSVVYACTTAAGVARFSAPSTELRTFIVFSNQSLPVPSYEGVVPSQNLRGIGVTHLLVITAPEFLSEAERFAAHRRSHSGLQVTVATTTQVYNEFSGGKQDITALRDFIKYLYDQGVGLEHVLLFGRGSYDYKNRLSFNKNFVPIYQSRNSLDPLKTYASDDYLGFLENTEGNWGEDPAEPHTMDIGVGRIPIKKLEEAASWVDKVIAYDQETNRGPWRARVLFTADDGDFNLHQSQAEQLALRLDTLQPEIDLPKVFLDAYAQSVTPSGPISVPARNALTQAVNEGVGIINFTGHGSELQWMQERMVDQATFDEWKPGTRYPFLVTATCEFGRNDDPGLISSAELGLFRKNSGPIGLVTTSRPVYSSTNFTLNNAFYQSLFTRKNGNIQDWGSVFRLTKNSSMSGVGNRNFMLLGDPSMLPPIGSGGIAFTEVSNLTSGSDTLKARSTVRVKGSVTKGGLMDAQFNGKVIITLLDKPDKFSTLGNENPPFTYQLRDDALFRGQASVQSGLFEATFILPAGMDPVVGKGVLKAYATNTDGEEALGAETDLKVGAAEPDSGHETSGPAIDLYMGDTTFVSGGLTGSSSRIIALLSDESGIDLSNFNPQNDITAVLDDTLTLRLNGYYTADTDTYSRGRVDYPIERLKPGSHLLTLYATDVYGNTTSASLRFTVTDATGIQIEEWLNYPNPFVSSTTFHFKHNRPGEDLEAMVTIFDRMGKLVMTNTYQVGGSTYQVDLPPWDGTSPDGNKLAGGLYLMKLTVRSLLDGSKNERIAKVILVN